MADANVISSDDAARAAWKDVYRCQAEAMSIVKLHQRDADPEHLVVLVIGVLTRFAHAAEVLERVLRNGGMGAMAPMVTKVVDS